VASLEEVRIRPVRRQSAVLLLAVLAVVAGLRLSTIASDTEAMRCAIACGHAAGVMNGAVCCPITKTSGAGPVLETCSRSGADSVVPLASGPVLLVFVDRLPVPHVFRPNESVVRATVRSAFLGAPEKVPLLLS
jgi:hypothetical protein